jgi:hypothetical protein
MRPISVFHLSQPVTQPDSTPVSDPGLDDVKTSVARILEFIVSDEARHRTFLQTSGFRPDADRDAPQSPLFLLTILDAVSKDQSLLMALEWHERITCEMIQMCQARLVFEISVEVAGLSRQGDAHSASK